jgi:predicted dehydrogenase
MASERAGKIRAAMVGCGRIGRSHLRTMLAQQDTTEVVVVSEPSPQAYAGVVEDFQAAGLQPPPNIDNLGQLLREFGSELDAVFINTPHAYHCAQTVACLEAGLDVLLEKPMVISAEEAEALIQVRDRTGQLLVVAFPGSLSPRIRKAVELLRSGELGTILSISCTVWENWRVPNIGTWRQVPAIAGGGFFFDTGAHMLNTLADLAGEDFTEVAAWLDNQDTPVDIVGAAMARLRSGAMVTLHACGDTASRARSEVQVFCTQGIIYTGIWGERASVQRAGSDAIVELEAPPSMGVWQQFVQVRQGELANPCPPEVGLRMARLWDAIQASAAQGGSLVSIGSTVGTSA